MEYGQIQERRRSILSLLKVHSVLTVEEICEQLKLTDSTARRDIKWLEEQNLIRRFHGGISSLDPQYDVNEVRNKKLLEVKKKIGKAAARYVNNYDSIFIGGGSTMFQFSKELLARQELENVVVVTATLNVASLFAGNKRFETIILGGSLKKTDETIASNMTIANAQTINYNKVFSGAMGISAACGITQPEPVLAELDRVLTSRAGKVYLLADHTKFGVVGPYTAYSLQQVHSIVTEKHPCVLEELEKAEQFSGNVLYVDE